MHSYMTRRRYVSAMAPIANNNFSLQCRSACVRCGCGCLGDTRALEQGASPARPTRNVEVPQMPSRSSQAQNSCGTVYALCVHADNAPHAPCTKITPFSVILVDQPRVAGCPQPVAKTLGYIWPTQCAHHSAQVSITLQHERYTACFRLCSHACDSFFLSRNRSKTTAAVASPSA